MKEIKHLITKLSQKGTSLKNFNIANNFQRKWLDVVAGRKDLEEKPPSTVTTVNNLMRVFVYGKACGTEDNKNCETNKKEM